MTKHVYFVANDAAGNRRETAALLVGTAEEFGIDQHDIKKSHTRNGFLISEALYERLVSEGVFENEDYVADEPQTERSTSKTIEPDPLGEVGLGAFDPGDHNVEGDDGVKAYVVGNPMLAEAVLAAEVEGKNRKSLVEWLTEFIETSGNRAAKNTGTEQE